MSQLTNKMAGGSFLTLFCLFFVFRNSKGNSEGLITSVIPHTSALVNYTHFQFHKGTPYDVTTDKYRWWLKSSIHYKFYAFDVDYARRRMYVFDAWTSAIYVFSDVDFDNLGPFNKTGFHSAVSSSIFVKIAVDWISNNVYWVDPLRQWIAVQPGTNLNYNASLYDVIIEENLDTPTGLAIDPIQGLLFWSNLGVSPKIERSSLSGSDRRAILSQGIGRPISIAVEYASSYIYWVDNTRDTIERADYDGNNRKTIRRISHTTFFDIALYLDSVLVTEIHNDKILLFNKRTGDLIKTHLGQNESFYGVKMFSSVTQPTATVNRCLTMNCVDMCIGGGTSTATCACRTGYKLAVDGRTCEEDSGELHRAIVVAGARNICLLNMHVLTAPTYRYLRITDIVSGTDDNSILFIDVDSNSRYIIFATSYAILRYTNKVEPLMATSEVITGLSLDWVDKNIYWTMGNTNGVINVWSAQSGSTYTMQRNLIKPRNIVVDPHERTMYWISGESGSVIIEKASTDGSGRTTVVTSGHLENPKSLILDYDEQLFYWSDEGVIRRCAVDGTGLESVRIDTTADFMNPDLLLIYKKYLLWTGVTSFNSTINVVEKESPFQKHDDFILDCAGKIVDIKAMDPVLQNSKKGPCKTLNGDCDHICIPLGQNRVCKCEFGYILHENKRSCLSTPFTDNFLIMTDWTHNKLYQVSLESGEARGLRTGAIGSPAGVAYDPVRSHVIWGESLIGKISLMTLTGTVAKVLSYTEFEFEAIPERFFIDHYSGYSYYTSLPKASGGFKGVAVVTPEGKHRQIINYGDSPRAIAVDMEEGIMFWTDHGLSKVLKAYLDGSGRTELYVAPILIFPNGIAIDYKAKQIYITDAFTDRIYQCSYTGPCTSAYTDKGAWLMSIFLSGNYLYYTSWNNPYVTRINKANFADKTRLSNNPELGRLDDIYVYSSSEPPQPAHSVCSANEGLGPCSTFCFPRGSVEYVCACEDGVSITDDKHRCENVPITTTSTTTSQTVTDENKGSDNSVAIGASVGGVVVLIIAIVIIAVYVIRNRKPKPPRPGFELPTHSQCNRPVPDTRRTQNDYTHDTANPSSIDGNCDGAYEILDIVSIEENKTETSMNQQLSRYYEMTKDKGTGYNVDHQNGSDYLELSNKTDILRPNQGHPADPRYQRMPTNAARLVNAPNPVYTINDQPGSDYEQPITTGVQGAYLDLNRVDAQTSFGTR